MDSTIYFEGLILVSILFGDVFCDHFVCDIARTEAEIASCPQFRPQIVSSSAGTQPAGDAPCGLSATAASH
jgi:hypothetical protein